MCSFTHTQMGLHGHVLLAVHQLPHPEVAEWPWETLSAVLLGAADTMATQVLEARLLTAEKGGS